MKISGSYEFNAAPEKVWSSLTDPESLSGELGFERPAAFTAGEVFI